jgi:hypothetical protein
MDAWVDRIDRPEWVGSVTATIDSERVVEYTLDVSSRRRELSCDGKMASGEVDGGYEALQDSEWILRKIDQAGDVLVVHSITKHLAEGVSTYSY